MTADTSTTLSTRSDESHEYDTSASVAGRWVDVCAYDDLIAERGAAALVGGHQVAVFRTYTGELYALSNRDPFSGAYVMARGILGTRGDLPTVASPMFKQVFDLRTGRCLDDPDQVAAVFRIRRTRDGRVEVALP